MERNKKYITRYLVSNPISVGAAKFIANIVSGKNGLSLRMVTAPLRPDKSEFAKYVRHVDTGNMVRYFSLKRKYIHDNLVEIKDSIDRNIFFEEMKFCKDHTKYTISKQRIAFSHYSKSIPMVPEQMLCELDIYRSHHEGLLILNILTDEENKIDMKIEFNKYPFMLLRIKRQLQDHEFTVNHLINNMIKKNDI